MSAKTSCGKNQLAPCMNCDHINLVIHPNEHICNRCQKVGGAPQTMVVERGYSFRDWGRLVGFADLSNGAALKNMEMKKMKKLAETNQEFVPFDDRVEMLNRCVTWLRGAGNDIVQKWPWVWDSVQALEISVATNDDISATDTRNEIRRILKCLAIQRGYRGHKQTGKDQPYWRDNKQPASAGTQKKESDMAILLDVQNDAPIAEGQHTAEIQGVEQKESKFQDAKHSFYLVIIFEVIAGVAKGQTIGKAYSPVASGKSNLGKLWSRLKGTLPIDGQIDVEQLIGEKCHVIVSHESGEDGSVRDRVSEVFSIPEEENIFDSN